MPGQASTVKKAARASQKLAKTPSAADGIKLNTAPRTVRPRQLHVNDKIRVVIGSEDPAVASIDNGALLEWLQRQEEEAQQSTSSGLTLQPRIAVIGHSFKPIPANLEDAELLGLTRSRSAVKQSTAQAIATPLYTNIQTVSNEDDAAAGKSAYIRYVVPTPDEEEATVEYDLDEEDEQWLQQHNRQGKQKLSEDDLERLIDAFEKLHHAEIQKHPERWANLIGSPLQAKDSRGKSTTTTGDGLHLPDVATVLPLQTALQGLDSCPPAVIKAVYLHWCHKRQYSERPLLQRLWYEPPWHRLTVAGSKSKANVEGDSEDDVPFMVQEERRPLRPRKTMQLQHVDNMLRDMRDDLEQVRILADQCRRREKLRKRALASWQQDMQMLHQQAVAMDQQRLHSSDLPNSSNPQLSAATPRLPSGKKKQQGGSRSTAKGKAPGSRQAQQLAADVAEATLNAHAKFEHDMALSLQLTRSVAEEAAKLHHVKIVRRHHDQPGSDDEDAAGPNADLADGAADMAGPSGQATQSTQGLTAPLQQISPNAQVHNAAADTDAAKLNSPTVQTSPRRVTRASAKSPGADGGTPLSAGQSEGQTRDCNQAELAASPRFNTSQRLTRSMASQDQVQGAASRHQALAQADDAEESHPNSPQRVTRSLAGQSTQGVDEISAQAGNAEGTSPNSPQRMTRSRAGQSTNGVDEALAQAHATDATQSDSPQRVTRSMASQHNSGDTSDGPEAPARVDGADTAKQNSTQRVTRSTVSQRYGQMASGSPEAQARADAADSAKQNSTLRLTRSRASQYNASDSPVTTAHADPAAWPQPDSARRLTRSTASQGAFSSPAGPSSAGPEAVAACLTRADAYKPAGSAKSSAARKAAKAVRFSDTQGAHDHHAGDLMTDSDESPGTAAVLGSQAVSTVRTTRSGRLLGAATHDSGNEAEDAAGAAAAAAASEDAATAAGAAAGLDQPWQQSLQDLGMSLGLPQEPQWPERGRPNANHPRHKSKSASLMRRTLSPLSSPRPLPIPTAPSPTPDPALLHFSGHARHASQMPAVRSTVDRGCDPIVFPKEAEEGSEEEAQEEENLSRLGAEAAAEAAAPARKAAAGKTRSGSKSQPHRPLQTNKRLKQSSAITPSEADAVLAADPAKAPASARKQLQSVPESVHRLHPSTRAYPGAGKVASPSSKAAATPSVSAPVAAINASRSVTRTAATAEGSDGSNAVAPVAAKAAATPAGKPPLPPTASKAVTADKAAQRGRSEAPQTAPPAKKSDSNSRQLSSALTDGAGDATTAEGRRAVTRHSGRQMPAAASGAAAQVMAGSDHAKADAASADDATVRQTRSRSISLGAELASRAAEATASPLPATRSDSRRMAPKSDPSRVPPSKKRKADDLLASSGGEESGTQRKMCIAQPGVSKQQRTVHQASSARNAADRITKGLVTSTRRQGLTAPDSGGAETHKGPAHAATARFKAKTEASVDSAPAAASGSGAAASVAAAAAALEQAAASGQLGCPKCRQAKFGCRKCRSKYVKVTGNSIPVDWAEHAAVFALLQRSSVNEAADGKDKSAAEASQETAKASVRQEATGQAESSKRLCSSRSQLAQQLPAATKRSSSSQPALQPETKKQKTSATQAEAPRGQQEELVQDKKQKQQQQQSSAGKGRQQGQSPASLIRSTMGKQQPASASVKQAPAIANSQSRLRKAGQPVQKAQRSSSLSTAAPTTKAGSLKKGSPVAAASSEEGGLGRGLKRAKLAGSPAPLVKRSRLSVGSTANKPAQQSRKAQLQLSKAQQQQHQQQGALTRSAKRPGSALVRTARNSPGPALPTQAVKPRLLARSSLLPKSASNAASVPPKTRAQTGSGPKALTAAKINTSAAGKEAAAAGRAVAQVLDSKLGCSKCRFVPSGCKRCKGKQAGQLGLAAAKRA